MKLNGTFPWHPKPQDQAWYLYGAACQTSRVFEPSVITAHKGPTSGLQQRGRTGCGPSMVSLLVVNTECASLSAEHKHTCWWPRSCGQAKCPCGGWGLHSLAALADGHSSSHQTPLIQSLIPSPNLDMNSESFPSVAALSNQGWEIVYFCRAPHTYPVRKSRVAIPQSFLLSPLTCRMRKLNTSDHLSHNPIWCIELHVKIIERNTTLLILYIHSLEVILSDILHSNAICLELMKIGSTQYIAINTYSQ